MTVTKLVIMKKLFTLSVVLLLTCSVFGQTQGAFNGIKKESDHLDLFVNELTNTYSFEADGKFYMLSYDTCSTCVGKISLNDGETMERELWLFCQNTNGVWSKATTEPIQIDYWKKSISGIYSHDLYFPRFTPAKNKEYVKWLKDGWVTMSIACQTIADYDFERSGKSYSDFYNRVIVLKPNGDGIYTVYGPKICMKEVK